MRADRRALSRSRSRSARQAIKPSEERESDLATIKVEPSFERLRISLPSLSQNTCCPDWQDGYNLGMDDLSGAERFRRLSAEEQARYLAINRQMVAFARDRAVPIIFAPPVSVGGKINGASGCVIQLGPHAFVVTASHVLSGYEERVQAGEVLNWQVGNLAPFDPLPRVAWRNKERDIVLLEIGKDEAHNIGPCTISALGVWPPPIPKVGQLVLVGGYPKSLREEALAPGWIGAGPYSAIFRVTLAGETNFKCAIERGDLISFDGPLPVSGTDMGGLSGGPVLPVDPLSYPLVGIVTDRCEICLADFEIIEVAALAGVKL